MSLLQPTVFNNQLNSSSRSWF